MTLARALPALALAIAVITPAQAASVDLLTAVRTARGDTIPTNAVLTDIAERRASEILVDFSHTGAGAPWLWGEILAVNSFDDDIAASSAIEGWLASPSHADVLLGDWTHVGVGTSEVGDNNYFVVVFAVIPVVPVSPSRPVLPASPTLPPTDTEPR